MKKKNLKCKCMHFSSDLTPSTSLTSSFPGLLDAYLSIVSHGFD